MMKIMKKLNTIDLFAGAGGLSLGFMKTGCFNIKAAVEFDKHAAETYAQNHEGVEVLQEDAAKISFVEKIQNKYGKIDVVIGGPPCQGFSNANRQKNGLVSGNNQLVQQYVRAIEELAPTAFVLENVKTLESSKHFFFVCDDNIDEVLRLNIPTREERIVICSGEAPTAFAVGVLPYIDQLDRYRMSAKGYSALCTLLKFSKVRKRAEEYIKEQNKKVTKLIDSWDSLHEYFWNADWEKFFKDSKDVISKFVNDVQDYNAYYERIKVLVEIERALERLHELKNNAIDYRQQRSERSIAAIADTFSVKDYLEYKFNSLGYAINMKILNAANFGVPQIRERFIMIGIKKEIVGEQEIKLPLPVLQEDQFNSVRDAIEDLENVETSIQANAPKISVKEKGHSQLASLLCTENYICNHVVTDTGETAKKRFKALEQGENFHNLDKSMKDTYSLPERTQNTIYLRLEYDKPSGTVVNVRKSMWIHPTLNRALSIREAARLQSFTDKTIFYGPKNSQYQQVGNAVPPLLGQAIAECLLEQLGIQSQSCLADELGIKKTIEK